MTKCFYCGKDIGILPYKCKCCQEYYCSKHRLPENHECVGDLKSKPKIKPKSKVKTLRSYEFQDESSLRLYPRGYRSYTDSEPKNTKYCIPGIFVIISVIILAYIYYYTIVNPWSEIVGNLTASIVIFGICILLPLLFTKPKNRSKLRLLKSIKKEMTKIMIGAEVIIFIAGIQIALYYTFYGMGDFVTVYWTWVGLSNLFLFSIYLEIKSRLDYSNKLEMVVKRLILLLSLIVLINIFMLFILGIFISLSIIPSITLAYFLEFFWIYYSLYIGFYLGSIVSRW